MRLGALADGRAVRIESDHCILLPGRVVDHLCRPEFAGRGSTIPFEDAVFQAPVARPGKVVCVGLNYLDHAEETNAKLPERPLLFAKAASCIIGPGAAIEKPRGEVKLDYEAELAVVIGRPARRVSVTDALGYVGGYACFNDVSERVAQLGDKQWFRGKSHDTFGPFGPSLVTPDEVGDPNDLAIKSLVNGLTRQDSSTSRMIFEVAELVSYCSHAFSLEPGDVIATGTPAGVALGGGDYLQVGDEVSVVVERVGTLTNRVVEGP